jgi:hypothetical protein
MLAKQRIEIAINNLSKTRPLLAEIMKCCSVGAMLHRISAANPNLNSLWLVSVRGPEAMVKMLSKNHDPIEAAFDRVFGQTEFDYQTQ